MKQKLLEEEYIRHRRMTENIRKHEIEKRMKKEKESVSCPLFCLYFFCCDNCLSFKFSINSGKVLSIHRDEPESDLSLSTSSSFWGGTGVVKEKC